MSRDQAIGGMILIVCLAVAIFYTATLFYPRWLGRLGLQLTESSVQFSIVAVPVFAAFLVVMTISAWIGWTMATTPPPKPTEESTSEID